MNKLTLRLDPDTALALRRLAGAECRSQNAQIVSMIRREATTRGLWIPSSLKVVPARRQSDGN